MITEGQGKKIALAAIDWLGTPHVNGAKVKGKGVDCGMFLIACVEGAGLREKNSIGIRPYSNEWHLHRSEEWFKAYVEKYCDEIKLGEMRAGDILLYQYGRCCSHGAIYVGNNMVIHSVVEQGVILSRLDDIILMDNKGQNRLRHVYRYRGDSNEFV